MHLLDRATGTRLRQSQYDLRHRDLQLAQGSRRPLHVRARHRHARLRQHRLCSALGQQPGGDMARAQPGDTESTEARGIHGGRGSAADGVRAARVAVAPGAARHRSSRRARAGPSPDLDRPLR